MTLIFTITMLFVQSFIIYKYISLLEIKKSIHLYKKSLFDLLKSKIKTQEIIKSKLDKISLYGMTIFVKLLIISIPYIFLFYLLKIDDNNFYLSLLLPMLPYFTLIFRRDV